MKKNTTKIKYVIIKDKLYLVKKINFFDMCVTLITCDIDISDIPDDEIFPIEDVKGDFHITIEN